jgi:hypothetical protein
VGRWEFAFGGRVLKPPLDGSERGERGLLASAGFLKNLASSGLISPSPEAD